MQVCNPKRAMQSSSTEYEYVIIHNSIHNKCFVFLQVIQIRCVEGKRALIVTPPHYNVLAPLPHLLLIRSAAAHLHCISNYNDFYSGAGVTPAHYSVEAVTITDLSAAYNHSWVGEPFSLIDRQESSSNVECLRQSEAYR